MEISVVREMKQQNAQLEHTLQLGAVNADLVQKEPTAQTMVFQHTLFVLMAPILMRKERVIVNCVTLATNVLVWEWKHLKNVPMEHTVTQLQLDIAFCVQKVIGERSQCLKRFHPCIVLLIHS